jgi:hypothetical protein
MCFVYGDVRVLIVSHERPRTLASAMRSVAAVELSGNPLSRDFWRRSIFDFCNNICQIQTHAPQQTRVQDTLFYHLVGADDVG